jgi:hypothetical protein
MRPTDQFELATPGLADIISYEVKGSPIQIKINQENEHNTNKTSYFYEEEFHVPHALSLQIFIYDFQQNKFEITFQTTKYRSILNYHLKTHHFENKVGIVVIESEN